MYYVIEWFKGIKNKENLHLVGLFLLSELRDDGLGPPMQPARE